HARQERRAPGRAEPVRGGDDAGGPLLAGEVAGAELVGDRRPGPVLAEPGELVQPVQGRAAVPGAGGRTAAGGGSGRGVTGEGDAMRRNRAGVWAAVGLAVAAAAAG